VADVHYLPDDFPDDFDGFPGRLPGGARLYLLDIAHVLRYIVIDLCLTPYIPLGNGDADRTGVVRGFGTFTGERYRIYCLVIFRIVKKNSLILTKIFHLRTITRSVSFPVK